MAQRKYDSTVARIAGNIASGLIGGDVVWAKEHTTDVAPLAVALARAIVAEVERTGPKDEARDDR